MSFLLRCLALALATAGLGCNIFSGPSSVREIRSAGTEAREAQLATMTKLIDRLAQRARARRDGRLEILLLSAGGQQGAYAAGFLRGWQVRTSPAMPAWDLVAGVGTGALQAPFALVGTQAAVERAAIPFRNEAIELVPAAEFWPAMQRAGGLPDDGPYHAAVERAIDPALQKDLRREFDALRQVVITTTDFDLGTARLWDLGHEIGTTEKGRKRAHALISASASAPGVYPPLMIDNHIHASGEVFGSVPVPLTFEDLRSLVRRFRAHSVVDTITIHVYVLLNGFVKPLRDPVDPADRRAMTERANALRYLQSQARALEHLTYLTDAVNGGIRGLQMVLRVSMIPASMAEEPGANEAHHETYAMQLEQVAYERARGDSQWDLVVEPRDRDD